MVPSIHITTVQEGYRIKLKHLTRDNFTPAIQALKRTIPANLRDFDADTKVWFVCSEGDVELNTWLTYMRVAHSAAIEWTGDEQPAQPQASDAYAALHLLPSAPPELVKAAYRELAKLNHPDKGGDVYAMQQINNAYRQIAA